MKVSTWLGVFKNVAGAEAFRQLESICPEAIHGDQRHSFRHQFANSDPRLAAVLQVLADARLEPSWMSGYKAKNTYKHTVFRQYEPADLDAVEFLQLRPFASLEPPAQEGMNEILEVQIAAVRRQRSCAMECVNGNLILVSDQLRRDVEGASFDDAAFRQVRARRKRTVRAGRNRVKTEISEECSWDGVGEPPWWQLWSTRVMPPLSPSMVLRTPLGEPLSPGYSEGSVVIHQPPFIPSELHYKRSAIESLPAFSFALTCEGRWKNRRLIVPQRVRKWFEERGTGMGFVPVRIDDE